MAYRLPPLSAVRHFEAAARHLSFKEAAAELHVTPSAISHGVRTLEEWLRAPLFVRGPRGLELTNAGRSFLAPVQKAFSNLARATEDLPGRKASGTLSVTAAPTFASRWLIPRLSRFAERYPDVIVEIDTDRRYVDLAATGTDLAIRMSREERPGGTWLRLVREVFVPVCSPAFLARHRGVAVDQLFRQATLIHLTAASEDWSWWMSRAGQSPPPGSQPSLKFDTIRMAIEAAAQGLGIALGRKPLINDDLVAGRLVEIGGAPQQGSTCYWLVGEERTFKRAEAKLFRRWLIEEIDATMPSSSEAGNAANPGSRVPASYVAADSGCE